jgi:hypothetical protein
VTLDRAIAAGAPDREDVASSALRSRSRNGGLGSDDKGLGWIVGKPEVMLRSVYWDNFRMARHPFRTTAMASW